MDEENEKQGKQQKTNQIKNMLSQEMKNRVKKELFKKLIIPVLPYLLIALCIGIGILFLYAGINEALNKDNSAEGKYSAALAVKNAGKDFAQNLGNNSEDDIPNKIILDNKNITEDGAYKLDYEFRDEEGNLLDEEQSLNKIKSDILKDSPNLKIDDFSNSELRILGALMYNGLDVEKYNFEELQAIALFIKVDLVSRNFDLRKEDSEITLEDLQKDDEIYGILEIYKTSIGTDGNYNPQKLQYVPYKDFIAMKNSGNQEVLSKFTLNKDGNLVYATINSSLSEYTYSDKNGEISYEEILEKNPEYALENKNEIKISSSKPFNYKPLIEKYRVSYNFLFDLLTATDNVDFCLDMAQLSLNSKIVINIKEELTVTVKKSKAEITQTTLLYDYVDYEVSGSKEKTEFIMQQTGDPSNSADPRRYGWNAGRPHTESENQQQVRTITYTWEYNDVKYQLNHTPTRNTWSLFKVVPDTDNELTLEKGQNKLINLNGNHITEVYDNYTINEDYTDKEEYTFTRETYIKNEERTYKTEILEIDCWYGTYMAEHKEPEIKSRNLLENNESIQKPQSAQYPQEAITTQEPTGNKDIINNDSHVKAFIKQKEEARTEDAECNVSKLTIKQKIKTEGTDNVYEWTTTEYKYGEEVADNAELTMKNVELVGDIPTFTAEDEDGNPEIGFLYILDTYMQEGNDVFLTDDSENRLFSYLEAPTDTEDETSSSQVSTIIRFLLYVYDGKDRGVKEIHINIVDIDDAILGTVSGGISPFGNTLTREEFIAKAEENGQGLLVELAGDFYDVCTSPKYNVNPCLAYSWAVYESSNGTSAQSIREKNLFGMAVYNGASSGKTYNSYAESIEDFCKWIINASTPGSAGYDGAEKRAKEYATVNRKFAGSPQNNIYAMFSRYMWLGETHKVDEKDSYESETERYNYYKNNGSNWGDGGRIQIYYMYEHFLYDGEYDERCTHKYATDETTLQEQADYVQYNVELRTQNAKEIFGADCFTGGSIVEAAYAVADYYLNCGKDIHYAGQNVEGSTKNGRRVVAGNVQASWDDPVKDPNQYGIVCGTFVTFSIWKAGLVDENTINKYEYHSCAGISQMLTESKYADEWEIIDNWDELQEGDIVWMTGHIFIYMEGEMCLDQHYCVLPSNWGQNGAKDLRGQLLNASTYKKDFIEGYRYIGK